MAKARRRRVKGRAPQQRKTNWLVVGGAIIGGAVILFGLLYLALREPEPLSITAYCENNEEACVEIGDANAPVTVIEVSDFGCSHCRDFHMNTYQALQDTFVDPGLVRWVFLPYSLSASTLPSANAAMCANEQAMLEPFTQMMFATYDDSDHLTASGIDRVAQTIGLDMASFNECVDDGRYVSEIQANQAAARTAGVTGTPSFFINDRIAEGALPLVSFQERINAALQAASAGS